MLRQHTAAKNTLPHDGGVLITLVGFLSREYLAGSAATIVANRIMGNRINAPSRLVK